MYGLNFACGGLNENDPYRLIYLNAWSLAGGIVLGKIRRCVTAGVGFEFFPISLFLSLLPI